MSAKPVFQLVESATEAPPRQSLRPRKSSRPSLPPHSLPGHPVAAYLEGLLARYSGLEEGEVATYIPELANADPSLFGIALVTCDGTLYEAGDSREQFTIQSISKPLTYGIALEDHGEEIVRTRIGIEPSGDTFNSISLAPDTGTPLNPMINAGAIAAASLISGAAGREPLDRVLETYSLYAGRPLEIDWEVCRSESASGHRNRAIAHLLRNAGVIDSEPEPVLDLYFQQCSVRVDCTDLGVIAATLANGGLNPLTGERAVGEETVRNVLSVMATCGMYDFAGEWLYAIGLPAKSGVSGGILAVLPGQLGLAVFSPPLDARGNSVRGVKVCEDVSRDLNLHLVQPRRRTVSPVRSSYDLTRIGSKRLRSERQATILEERGSHAGAYELQGEISFAAAEEIARRLVEASNRLEVAVVDFRRSERIDPAVVPLFAHLAAGFAARGAELAFSGLGRQPDFARALDERLASEGVTLVTFPELDLALEWCERTLLRDAEELDPSTVPLDEHELLRGLSPAARDRLLPSLRARRFTAGMQAIKQGEAGEGLLLVTRGHLSVTTELPGGERRRLATVSAGMVLGELSIGGRGHRTADVWADTDVECHTLTTEDLGRLGQTDPEVACVVLENLLRIVGRTARRMTMELAALAR